MILDKEFGPVERKAGGLTASFSAQDPMTPGADRAEQEALFFGEKGFYEKANAVCPALPVPDPEPAASWGAGRLHTYGEGGALCGLLCRL